MNISSSKLSRKKLWDIPNVFHCSIAGTCLTLKDARRIISKAGYKVSGSASDYDIHGIIVTCSKDKNNVSNIVHKTLERRFSREISEYNAVNTEEELKTAWNESFSRGDIAGAYWAVMTHPLASNEFLAYVFGEVHMLSHINGASGRGNIERVHMLESMLETMKKNKKTLKIRLKELENQLIEKSDLSLKLESMEEELTNYKKQLQEFRNGGTYSRLFNELMTTVNMYETERFHKEKALSRLSEAEKKFEKINNLNEKNSNLKEENSRLKEELFYLENEFESSVLSGHENHKGDCAGCAHDKCRCGGIKGRTILYVGGKSSAIPHYRAVVEKKGGVFIHHDGGQENNMSILAKDISRADAVYCPVDCVSHNACQMIKKICQQSYKEFAMLRSSGVSSLVREINGHDKSLSIQ
jgi:hypothetical protein